MSTFTKKEVAENYIKGLEMTLNELQPKLDAQVDGLSTKQLRRALKATISYVTTREDDRDASALKPEENEFIGGLFAAIESGVQYSIHIIGEMQRQQQDAEKAQGENNER